MAETQSTTDGYGTYYWIDSSSSRDVLSWQQMLSNASYFRNYANANYGSWTLNAIAGMLGNIRYEGVMNPSQWQYGLNKSENGGYGLCQWTPATKLLNWIPAGESRTAMKPQIDRINFEAENGGQWITTSKYPMSFDSFLHSDAEPEYLASVWLYNYERPKHPQDTESYRKSMARTFYDYLYNEEPGPTPPPDPPEPPTPPVYDKRKGMSIALYHRRYD